MDIDADGSLGRAMSLSYAEQQGREAKSEVAQLKARVERLERIIEQITLGAYA